MYPGSWIWFFSIRDPGSDFFHPGSQIRFREFKHFNPKNGFYALGNMGCSSRILDPDPYFLPIPDPGIKKAPDPGYGTLLFTSVAGADPYVFGPTGSRSIPISISQRYGSGSGSGSFYHQTKIVSKTLIPPCVVTSFWLFIFEKWCNCTFKKE